MVGFLWCCHQRFASGVPNSRVDGLSSWRLRRDLVEIMLISLLDMGTVVVSQCGPCLPKFAPEPHLRKGLHDLRPAWICSTKSGLSSENHAIVNIVRGIYIYIPDSHYPSRIPESNLVDPNSRWFTM